MDDAVVDNRLDWSGGRNRVEVRTEEEGRAAVGGRFHPRVDVSHRRADARARIVLVCLQPQAPQVARDDVCDRTLVPGRAGECGELHEQVQHLGCHPRTIL